MLTSKIELTNPWIPPQISNNIRTGRRTQDSHHPHYLEIAIVHESEIPKKIDFNRNVTKTNIYVAL